MIDKNSELSKKLEDVERQHGLHPFVARARQRDDGDAETTDAEGTEDARVIEAIKAAEGAPVVDIKIHEYEIPKTFAALRTARREGWPTNRGELALWEAKMARGRAAAKVSPTERLSEMLDDVDRQHGVVVYRG